jgi:hypothetical protein
MPIEVHLTFVPDAEFGASFDAAPIRADDSNHDLAPNPLAGAMQLAGQSKGIPWGFSALAHNGQV